LTGSFYLESLRFGNILSKISSDVPEKLREVTQIFKSISTKRLSVLDPI